MTQDAELSNCCGREKINQNFDYPSSIKVGVEVCDLFSIYS